MATKTWTQDNEFVLTPIAGPNGGQVSGVYKLISTSGKWNYQVTLSGVIGKLNGALIQGTVDTDVQALALANAAADGLFLILEAVPV